MEVVQQASKRGKDASAADWTSVPQDLLQHIAVKLTNIRDYIRFRSVCQSWRLAACPADFTHPQQLPLLILPSPSPSPRPTISVLNLSDRRIYKLYLPEAQGKLLYGSSHGWLVMLDIHGSAVSLLNPITRDQITLPKLPQAFPSACCYSAYKVLLCSSPAVTTNQQLLLAIWVSKMLFFIRQGDDRWSQVCYNSTEGDMAFYQEKLCLVDRGGRLQVLDAASSRITEVLPLNNIRPYPFFDWNSSNVRVHLVEAAGDLFLLEWQIEGSTRGLLYLGYRLDDIGAKDFVKQLTVYKLTKRSSELKWTKTRCGIGNKTLFANLLQCVAVSDLPADSIPGGNGASQIWFFTGQPPEKFEVLNVAAGDIKIIGNPELNSWMWPERVKLMPGFTWLVPSMC